MAEHNHTQQDATTGDLQMPRRLRSVPGAQAADAQGSNVQTASAEAHANSALRDNLPDPRVVEGDGAAASAQDTSVAPGEEGASGKDKPATKKTVHKRPPATRAVRAQAKSTEANEGSAEGSSDEDADSGKPATTKAVHRRSASDAAPRAGADEQLRGQGSPDEASTQDEAPKKPRRRVPRWRIAAVLVGVLLVAVAVSFGLFSWDRWMRYDDASDIQGRWYAAGTSVPISLNDHAIQFDEHTSYEYSLDTEKKVISYQLGNLEGGGHYRFCGGRQYLVIADGSGYSKWGTALDDLVRDVSEFFGGLASGSLQLPEGEGVIVLSRTPSSRTASTEFQQASSQAGQSRQSQEAGQEQRAQGEQSQESRQDQQEQQEQQEQEAEQAGQASQSNQADQADQAGQSNQASQ